MKKINGNSKYSKKVAFTFKGMANPSAANKSGTGHPTTTTLTTHTTVSYNCFRRAE